MTLIDRWFKSSATRLAAATVLVALLGSVSLTAWARPGGQDGHGGHGGGGMGFMHGRGMERMLDAVNATADQRSQIKAIAERAKNDLKAQHDSRKGLRDQSLKLFAEPVVDANRAEALRQQTMQQHDQTSRRIMQAMLDMSRVLTPEQRKQLADRMAQRGAMMERHHRERETLAR
jgi:Spy/CpxP family protein refolding chaperone